MNDYYKADIVKCDVVNIEYVIINILKKIVLVIFKLLYIT